MPGADVLASAVVGLASRGAREIVIDMHVWSGVVDPFPQRTGERVYSGEGFRLRVSRIGGIYGFLEAEYGGCRVYGVLVYGQSRSLFRVSGFEGSGGCGGSAPGVEPREG